MIIKYEGIFGGGVDGLGAREGSKKADPKNLTAREQKQLESVLKGGRAFFFSNWIFEYDSSVLQEILDKLKNGGKINGTSHFDEPEEKLLLAALNDL